MSIRLALLNGTFYDNLPHDFDQVWIGGRYVWMRDRRPNVPTGSNELVIQTERHCSTLFGEANFPDIETVNEAARTVLAQIVDECGIAEVMREAARLASAGSAAVLVKALGRPGDGGKARLDFEVFDTVNLTPVFDPYRPGVVLRVTERKKIAARDLMAEGYVIAKEDQRKMFWFQRIWDQNADTWFLPWTVEAQRKADAAGEVFTPVVDEARTVVSNLGLGRSTFVWVRPPGAKRDEIDGRCTFAAGVDHAIALDYQDSQIVAGVEYAMSPTMVIETPPTAPNPDDEADGAEGGAMVKDPGTTLTLPQGGKAYYVEMTGQSFKEAREKAKELKTSVITAIHGDKIDPKEVTQAHQGQNSLKTLNDAMLKHVESLRGAYGRVLLDLLRLCLDIVERRSIVVKGVVVDKAVASATDLSLQWPDVYPLSPQERYSLAQTVEVLIRSGVQSRENATKLFAPINKVTDVAAERALVDAEQAREDARIKALGAEVQDRVQMMGQD